LEKLIIEGFDRVKYYDMEEIPIGTHIAFIYHNTQKKSNVLKRFFEIGFKRNHKAVYLVDEEEQKGDINLLMGNESQSTNNRIIIENAMDVYCAKGKFSLEEMFNNWGAFIQFFEQQGFDGVRAVGEMSWALKGLENSKSLFEYESKLRDFFKGKPILACCAYDARLFNGQTILDVLKTHKYVFIDDKIFKNPFQQDVEEFLENYVSHALSNTY